MEIVFKKPFEHDGSGVALKILFRYRMVRYSFLRSAIFTAVNQHRLVRERQSRINRPFPCYAWSKSQSTLAMLFWCYGLQSHYTDPNLH